VRRATFLASVRSDLLDPGICRQNQWKRRGRPGLRVGVARAMPQAGRVRSYIGTATPLTPRRHVPASSDRCSIAPIGCSVLRR